MSKKWSKSKAGLKYHKKYARVYSQTLKGRAGQLRRAARRWKKKYIFIADRKNRPCTDCGGWFEPCQMDFDHVRGEKRFCLSTSISRTLHDVLEEIKKCELVCSNCHRLRTFIRRQNVHKGSVPRYSYGNELSSGTVPNQIHLSRPPSLRNS